MRLGLLTLLLAAAPEVTLPEKKAVPLPIPEGRSDRGEAIRAGVKAARRDLEACWLKDAGWSCSCAALEKVRFDLWLDGGVLTVTYPLVGHVGPSFTINSEGRVVDCR